MQGFIIATMCIINIVLWLVFFIKFKRLFTVDDEIQKARSQFELLINDINRNTLSNIDLIDAKIAELNELVQAVDRKMLLAQDEVQKKRNEIILQSTVSKGRSKKNASVPNYARTVIDQDSAFEVNVDTKKRRAREKLQTELFDEGEKEGGKNSAPDGNASGIHVVDSQGNAYGEVPVVSPKIYMAENPIQTHKDFRDEVIRLMRLGFDAEQIARKVNKSTTEIQCIIDLN